MLFDVRKGILAKIAEAHRELGRNNVERAALLLERAVQRYDVFVRFDEQIENALALASIQYGQASREYGTLGRMP